MSGLEVVGIVLGATAFAGQMMHMWRKRKAYKESTFTEKDPAASPLQVTESVATSRSYQGDGTVVVSERRRSRVLRRSNDQAIQAGFQQMGNMGMATLNFAQQMHSQHTEDQAMMRKSYDEVNKTVFQEMGKLLWAMLHDSRQLQSQHRAEQRRTTQAIIFMTIMAGLLLYLLGYYHAQASLLVSRQSWQLWSRAGLASSSADKVSPTLFAGLVSLFTATIRGYFLIPVMLPFAGLTSIIEILRSCLEYAVSSAIGIYGSMTDLISSAVASQQLDPGYSSLAVALAVIVKMAIFTAVSVSLWPAKFIFQFLSTLLRVFHIPPLVVHILLCLLGSPFIVEAARRTAEMVKGSPSRCDRIRRLESELGLFLMLSSFGTFFFQSILNMVDGYQIVVSIAIFLYVGGILYDSTRCSKSLLICAH